MTSQASKVITIIINLIATGILLTALGYGIVFAFFAVICTGGGTLIIIIPIAIVVLPISWKALRYIWRRKKSPVDKVPGLAQEQKPMSKNDIALVRYIGEARAANMTDDQIRSELTQRQWAKDDINSAFEIISKKKITQ
jgi:hypothetical protein